MTFLRATLFAVLLSFVNPARSQESPLGPLQLGMDPAAVEALLQSQGLTAETFVPETLSFPQAGETESHWVVRSFQAGGRGLERLALVFADGKLVFIEGTGGVTALLDAFPDAAYQEYEAYRFYEEWSMVANTAADRFWQLTPEGMHLNLFAWEHPLLDGSPWQANPAGVEVPEFLEMGASLEQLEPRLEAASTFIIREELDGSDPNAQLQLNCYGIPYAGFARKAEARFGDGHLNVVWLLTAKAEEDRIRRQLRTTYGDPVFVSDDWEAYQNWQVFLRKDKPEVLLLTPELGQYYKKEYFGQ